MLRPRPCRRRPRCRRPQRRRCASRSRARARCRAWCGPRRPGRSARRGAASAASSTPAPSSAAVRTPTSPARATVRVNSRRGRHSGSRSRRGSRRRSGASAGGAGGRRRRRPRPRARCRRGPRRSRGRATTFSSTGSAFVRPSATTSLPLSSSERNRISSISAPACSTSARACSSSVVDVGAGQVGRVEQREDPGQRRAQLVRDGRREPGAKLVEAGVVHRVLGTARLERNRHGSGSCSSPRLAPKNRFTRSSPFRNPDRTVHRTMVGAWPRS